MSKRLADRIKQMFSKHIKKSVKTLHICYIPNRKYDDHVKEYTTVPDTNFSSSTLSVQNTIKSLHCHIHITPSLFWQICNTCYPIHNDTSGLLY
jgi:hypothetical protein